MIAALMLAACAAGLSRITREKAEDAPQQLILPRFAYVVGTACVIFLGCALIRDRIGPALAEPYWDNFLVRAQRWTKTGQSSSGDTNDFFVDESIEAAEPTAEYTAQLEAALQWHPEDYRAHERMATICLMQFEALQQQSDCPLSLEDLRDAAFASRFQTQAEMDAWLGRALGERRRFLDKALWHARQALACCPLRGECYLHLAKLEFVELGTSVSKDELIAQALRVRPGSGAVLFAAGREALLAGDTEKAAALWRRCYHSGPVYQQRMTDLFLGRFSAEFFCTTFQPDLPAFRLLYQRNRQIAEPQEHAVFLAHYARVAEQEAKKRQGDAAVRLWLDLHGLQMELGDYRSAQASVQQALAGAPNHFDARYKLARCLLLQKQFDEAYEQLRWCLLRRPNDATLQRWCAAAVQGRLAYKSRKGN
jgi:Tfp pilus assembly protein PilF